MGLLLIVIWGCGGGGVGRGGGLGSLFIDNSILYFEGDTP